MKQYPIILTDEESWLILEAGKRQLRRVFRYPAHVRPEDYHTHEAICRDGDGNWHAWSGVGPFTDEITTKLYPKGNNDGIPCPFGKPGDQLLVKETWRLWDGQGGWLPTGDFNEPDIVTENLSDFKGRESWLQSRPVEYRSTSLDPDGPWRASVVMPKWASRLALEVTDVRVERLQDITDDDGRAEGFFYNFPLTFREVVKRRWNKSNPKFPWDFNPWVYAISFEVKNLAK